MKWSWRKRAAGASLESPTGLGPLTTNPTVSAAYLATTPLHYWPLDETSGTTAADLVASGTLNGTCSGMTMGGTDAPTGIGGKAPLFSGGSEHIVLKAGKILGGNAAWSVAAWIKYSVASNDPAERMFYGEANPTTGNDELSVGVNGAGDSQLRIRYGDDTQAANDLAASSVFINGGWAFVVLTRNGATLEYWMNLGRRTLRTDGNASNLFTNSGVVTWLGNLPRDATRPWKGSMAHVAVYDRVLSKADQKTIYEACTPYTRTIVDPDAVFTRPTSIWKQRLDQPSNPPTIAADSGTTVAKLVAQANQYTAGSNQSTGPLFVVTNATPVQRMRISGGHDNIFFPPLEMYDAMGLFRPAPLLAAGGIIGFEDEASVWNSDTNEFFEFFGLAQTYMPGNVFSGVSGAGTVPAGTHTYFVVGANASNQTGRAYWQTSVTVNGSQGVALGWTESEGIDHYAIYRDGFLIATRASGVTTMTDTGLTAGAAYPGITATTTDWGCLGAGYMADTSTSVGNYEAPRDGWGTSGSRLPIFAGSVSIKEAQAGVIPHALSIGLPEVAIEFHVYPATRNDGTTYPNRIPEGTRFRLKAATDISTLPAMEKMCAQALKTYGGYVRDVTGEVSIYTEEAIWLGDRDPWFEINEGRYDYELFSVFPWDQMEVIDPAWTQAETTAVIPPDLFETLVEPFTTALSGAVWTGGGANVTVSGGRCAFDVNPGYTGSLTTVATTHYSLTGSHVLLQVPTVPRLVPGSEGLLTLSNQGDTNCFIEMGYTDDAQLIAGYNSSGLVRTRAHQATYSAVDHAWWRIREAAGTVYWEVSSDGATWHPFASVAWAATGWSADKLDDMRLTVFAGNFNGLNAGAAFVIDNVNVPGTGGSTSPSESQEPNKVMALVYQDGQRTFGWVPLDEL